MGRVNASLLMSVSIAYKHVVQVSSDKSSARIHDAALMLRCKISDTEWRITKH